MCGWCHANLLLTHVPTGRLEIKEYNLDGVIKWGNKDDTYGGIRYTAVVKFFIIHGGDFSENQFNPLVRCAPNIEYLLVCGYDPEMVIKEQSAIQNCIKKASSEEMTSIKHFKYLIAFGIFLSKTVFKIPILRPIMEKYFEQNYWYNQVSKLEIQLEQFKYSSKPGEYFIQLYEDDNQVSFSKFDIFKQYLQN